MPTLVVPDEQTWALAGADPAGAGLRPAFAPAGIQRVLVPDRLPDALADALAACMAQLPPGVEVDRQVLHGFEGEPLASMNDGDVAGPRGRTGHAMHDGHAGHEMHGHQDMHGDHHMHGDHGDMMAIVGEPSADGLVMESIDLRFGPLGTPLPGGLAVDITLDGDVVAESAVHALLSNAGRPSPPDLLAPVAWDAALTAAGDEPSTDEARWLRLVAAEFERALSHLAWLRAFGRVLGWEPLVDRCSAAVRALGAARRQTGDEAALETARAAVNAVVALVTRSRWLRLRTAGQGMVTQQDVLERGLRGPLARASGVADDARSDDPLYRRLGFTPLVRSGGDALARALLRAEEAGAALDLIASALRHNADGAPADAPFGSPDGATVEGPRGSLCVRGRHLEAAGAGAALEAAGAAMVGSEWTAALVTLVSFDLSPWRVHV